MKILFSNNNINIKKNPMGFCWMSVIPFVPFQLLLISSIRSILLAVLFVVFPPFLQPFPRSFTSRFAHYNIKKNKQNIISDRSCCNDKFIIVVVVKE